MGAPNSSPSVAELMNQISELKQAIAKSVENKESDAAKVVALQSQLDALDIKMALKMSGGFQQKSLADELKENESLSRLLRDKKGRAYLDLSPAQMSGLMGRKTIITEVTTGSVNGDPLAPVGTQTTGVLPIQRIPGIVPEARQTLKIRDVLSASPTNFAVIDYIKVNTPMSIASPVPEASVKPENQLTFTAYSERVKLLATFILATRQVLDDLGELLNFLKGSLSFYVDLEEELQLLAGDNVGEDLHGLLPQASAFNTALLPKAALGWTKIDIIAIAMEQIQIAKEIEPTFAVLNPQDWWQIRLTKDGFGRYILGDPQSQVRPSLFGLDVVVTTSMPAGSFLIGSGSPVAAEIRDRMGMAVEISSEDQDNFRRNLITIRAEKRLALVVKRGASFISGTFTTSP